MDSGPQSEFGWAQQDVTNLNELRAPWVGDLGGVGLGLGEMPLRRWEAVTEMGRSQALIRTIATPSQRQTIDRGTTPRLTSVGYTLVTPTGVAKCALNTPHTSADMPPDLVSATDATDPSLTGRHCY